MKKVRVEDSVGMVLGHDLTKVVPGFKGTAFKKGHIIREEDIETLKDIGKEHIYLLELRDDQIHEENAAIRMATAAVGQGIRLTDPSEGCVNFIAEHDGLLRVDADLLRRINNVDEVCMAMLHNYTPVTKEQVIAGTRIVPLVTSVDKIEQVEQLCAGKTAVQVKPFRRLKIGAVVTGNEVYYGRIQDRFAPVFGEKMQRYNCTLQEIIYVPDQAELIRDAIMKMLSEGCEAIITSGGMSVDPDDVTPDGIRMTGAQIVRYGSPVLPGSMFMMAYHGEVPIMGVPACGMYNRTTIFDLLFPRVLAGEKISKEDIAELGHGGLCLRCKECIYPKCSFGK